VSFVILCVSHENQRRLSTLRRSEFRCFQVHCISCIWCETVYAGSHWRRESAGHNDRRIRAKFVSGCTWLVRDLCVRAQHASILSHAGLILVAGLRKFPKHEHIGGEQFLVLEGTFKDQFGEYSAGSYVRNPIGSAHAPWVDDDGCTIMVKLLQMADTGEGTSPLCVNLDKAKVHNRKVKDNGTVVICMPTGKLVKLQKCGG
jgi:hypothetical protein